MLLVSVLKEIMIILFVIGGKVMGNIINLKTYKRERSRGKMCQEIMSEIASKRDSGNNYAIKDMPEIAESILQSVNPNATYPVPIVKIARAMGFIVYQMTMEEKLSGFIGVGDDVKKSYGHDKVICVNINDEIGHQRFVIAHELAHYLFHYGKTDNSYYDTYEKNSHKSLKEQLANQFAANLLMPKNELSKDINEKVFTENLLKDLMEKYQVQEKAILKRILEV